MSSSEVLGSDSCDLTQSFTSLEMGSHGGLNLGSTAILGRTALQSIALWPWQEDVKKALKVTWLSLEILAVLFSSILDSPKAHNVTQICPAFPFTAASSSHFLIGLHPFAFVTSHAGVQETRRWSSSYQKQTFWSVVLWPWQTLSSHLGRTFSNLSARMAFIPTIK